MFNRSVVQALLAAMLFGASTPLAKWLTGEMQPVLLAGLLYLGSGIGLSLAGLLRGGGPAHRTASSGLAKAEWPWFIGAVFFGGVLAPVALAMGLAQVGAATASLLLNLEAVLTAVIAWVIFRENAGRRVVAGMLSIVAGGLVLSGSGGDAGSAGPAGPALVALACLCWAVDNNLTRKVSAADALFIAATKGLMAGAVNTGIALLTGATLPGAATFAAALAVGLAGYGISLVCFVLALRGLGAARTGAYFATAPFMGAAMAVAFMGESVTVGFWVALALMGLGVWLHVTENHEHAHVHAPLEHSHPHVHDSHHQHAHGGEGASAEPHEHWHRHVEIRHKHPHFPDIHHGHRH